MAGAATIKSLSIETEKSVAFHQEVTTAKTVNGLICRPDNEFVSETHPPFEIWVRCNFDLSKATVSDLKEIPEERKQSKTKEIISEIPAYGTTIPTTADHIVANQNLVVTSIPQCDEILIRGKRPRIVKCKTNPQSIFLDTTDSEVIIRASGYLPKHISLEKIRTPVLPESAEVYLEKQ